MREPPALPPASLASGLLMVTFFALDPGGKNLEAVCHRSRG